MFECSITLKNSEQRYTKKSLQYEEGIVISEDSPLIMELVQKAKSEFKGEVEDARVVLTLNL